MNITSKPFLTATAERAIKTFAQALAALLIGAGTDLISTDWAANLSIAGMAAVVSILTSIGSSAVGSDPGPSLADEKVDTEVPEFDAPISEELAQGDE